MTSLSHEQTDLDGDVLMRDVDDPLVIEDITSNIHDARYATLSHRQPHALDVSSSTFKSKGSGSARGCLISSAR